MNEPRTMDTVCELVLKAAETALTLIHDDLDVEEKPDDLGPVTKIDRAVSHLLVQGLRKEFPNDRICSEEEPSSGPSKSERTWFIDPIDGTKDLIQGSEEWSIILGLAVRGQPALGVVAQPRKGCLYYGSQEEGAFRRFAGKTERIHANPAARMGQWTAVMSRNHPDERANRVFHNLGIHQRYQHGSVGLKLAHIAEGQADIYMNFSGRCHLWDLCGAEAILNAAGGKIRTLAQKSIDYAQPESLISEPFFASSPGLDQVIQNVSLKWEGL